MAQMDQSQTGQWEYRVAYVDSRGRISCEGVEFIRQSGEHRTTFVSRYLTALGREGWSLSGIQHLGRAETAYYVLQRPLVVHATPAEATEPSAAAAGTPA